MCRAEIKWILLRQPSPALLDVSVHRRRPREWPVYGFRLAERHVPTWKGLVIGIQEECNEEVEAVVEMLEDGCGQRQLVCSHARAACLSFH